MRFFNKGKQYNGDVKVLSIKNAENYELFPDEFEVYNCNCKCNLKECDYDCWRFFVEQDYRPYRNPKVLKPISESQKMKSYNHFIKMLKKRNKKPYYFFREMFSKIKFHARRLWWKYR